MAEVKNQLAGIARRRAPVRLPLYPTNESQIIVYFDDFQRGLWPGMKATGAIFRHNHMATVMPMKKCDTTHGASMHLTEVKRRTGKKTFTLVNFSEYYENKYGYKPEEPLWMVELTAGRFLSTDLYVILSTTPQRN